MKTTKSSCLARQELGRQNRKLVRERAKITRFFKEVLETDNTHTQTHNSVIPEQVHTQLRISKLTFDQYTFIDFFV